jgi:hypothetical protein
MILYHHILAYAGNHSVLGLLRSAPLACRHHHLTQARPLTCMRPARAALSLVLHSRQHRAHVESTAAAAAAAAAAVAAAVSESLSS